MMAYIISTTWSTGSARLHLSLPLKMMNFCQKKAGRRFINKSCKMHYQKFAGFVFSNQVICIMELLAVTYCLRGRMMERNHGKLRNSMECLSNQECDGRIYGLYEILENWQGLADSRIPRSPVASPWLARSQSWPNRVADSRIPRSPVASPWLARSQSWPNRVADSRIPSSPVASPWLARSQSWPNPTTPWD